MEQVRFYLINYSVKGIKSLDNNISLSFYKKTISKDIDVQEYNVKAIYGMNGSGKTGIIASVDILKQLIINPNYLNNPIIQKKLNEVINKKTNKLSVCVDFVLDSQIGGGFKRYVQYRIDLSKNNIDKYEISCEHLMERKLSGKTLNTVFKTVNGEFSEICDSIKDPLLDNVISKTKNLLVSSTLSSLFWGKDIFALFKTGNKINKKTLELYVFVFNLFTFGTKIHVFVEDKDNYDDYIISEGMMSDNINANHIVDYMANSKKYEIQSISPNKNIVSKLQLADYKKMIERLYKFICIFKPDLKDIEIDAKENGDLLICELLMVYDGYKINTEYESNGIKKLIRLFTYLDKMVQGEIVFIDEFDSNLHDVYLCALLEYLMEYAKGQLCFTTHNIGPMDILRRNKKSIDFLSGDHKIYSWINNGNYSPSKLYRSGMIEGSPFNIDSTSFIGIFIKNIKE